MKNIVFLIEDELDIMYAYKMALTGAGVVVVPLSSGKEAMEAVRKVQEKKEAQPGLVLLDLVLPDINGLEILYALKKHETTKDVPVFILSNYNSDALHNMSAIKPDKIFIKSDIKPTALIDIVKAELAQTAGGEAPKKPAKKPKNTI